MGVQDDREERFIGQQKAVELLVKSLKFKVKSCPQNAAELLVQSIRFKV